MTTPETFIDQVLALLPDPEREAATADLRAAFAEGVTPEQLGSPAAYAEAICGGEESRPRRRLLGMPVDFGGPTDARSRSRVWDPENPAILVPRLFGAGWDLNLGAVAVRLGLVRPDDTDADVLAAIPPQVMQGVRLVPVGLALATAALSFATRRITPAGGKVPTGFTLLGTPNRWSGRWVLGVFPAVGAAIAAWGAGPAEGDDAVARPMIATTLGALLASTTALTYRGARSPQSAQPLGGLAILVVPVAAGLAAAVIPIRAGVRRVAGTPSSTA